jgi:hypothetical protein
VSITPQTKSWLRQSAAVDGAAYSQVLLYLLERVEALEAAENLRQQDEDSKLAASTPDFRALCAELLQPLAEYDGANPYHEHRALITRARYDLGRQPAPPPAHAGGLVERVAHEVTGQWHQSDREAARAAIREVAAWMRENKVGYNAVRWLEQEADCG